MEAISYSNARANLARTMQRVCRDRVPVIVTRRRQPAVVMLSQEDYQAMEETAHLLRSPANARRLLLSVRRLEAGKGKVRALLP